MGIVWEAYHKGVLLGVPENPTDKCIPNINLKDMDVSKNSGTPKSSILIGFSIIFTIHFGVFPPIYIEDTERTNPPLPTRLSHRNTYFSNRSLTSLRQDKNSARNRNTKKKQPSNKQQATSNNNNNNNNNNTSFINNITIINNNNTKHQSKP